MPKQVKALFLAGMALFVAALIGMMWSQEHPAWKSWQEKYFQSQIKALSQQLVQTTDLVQRASIQQQISQLNAKKPEVVNLVLPNGKTERCQTCHLGLEEISPSHPVKSMGCTVCHGGNPLSLDQETAHAGMYGAGHPGQLNASQLSCGQGNGECHSGHSNPLDNQVDLVRNSLMATKGGELSMTRYMYGLDIPPKVIVPEGQTAEKLPAPFSGKPLESQLRANCLTQCHQSNGKLPGQANLAYGCESCHVLKDGSYTYQGQDVTIPKDEKGHGLTHRLTVQIPYTQCNQCHNQGMPDLFKMEFNWRKDLEGVKSSLPSELENLAERKRNVYQPGFVFAQCEVSLDCIDCHSRQEVMGDGHAYSTEYQALKVQCKDCHGTLSQPPTPWTVSSAGDMAFQEAQTNPVFPKLTLGGQILITEKGEELPFVRVEGGRWFLYRKVTGKKYSIPLAYGSACLQKPDKQTSNDCHKCHND